MAKNQNPLTIAATILLDSGGDVFTQLRLEILLVKEGKPGGILLMNDNLAYVNNNLRAMVEKAAALVGTMLERTARAPVEVCLRDEIEKARAEWQAAQEYFEMVTDPELIDFAIFNLEAARRRYSYLLKQARLSEIASGVS